MTATHDAALFDFCISKILVFFSRNSFENFCNFLTVNFHNEIAMNTLFLNETKIMKLTDACAYSNFFFLYLLRRQPY